MIGDPLIRSRIAYLARPSKKRARAGEASAVAERSEEKLSGVQRSEAAVGDHAAAAPHADGTSTAAADLPQAEGIDSAEVEAAQHMEGATEAAGPLTADGVVSKLDSSTLSAVEAPERNQNPVRTGSGNRQQSPATGASPQAAAKHGKGQRTMQSFFTSKPST